MHSKKMKFYNSFFYAEHPKDEGFSTSSEDYLNAFRIMELFKAETNARMTISIQSHCFLKIFQQTIQLKQIVIMYFIYFDKTNKK